MWINNRRARRRQTPIECPADPPRAPRRLDPGARCSVTRSASAPRKATRLTPARLSRVLLPLKAVLAELDRRARATAGAAGSAEGP